QGRPTRRANQLLREGISRAGIHWWGRDVKAILAFMGRILALAMVVLGCAPMAAQHQADAAFRRALTAQLAGDEARAETNYQEVLKLGMDDSPTLNNLGVIAVHRHNYIGARHLFGRAVQADGRDVVALTNYGVLSFYL